MESMSFGQTELSEEGSAWVLDELKLEEDIACVLEEDELLDELELDEDDSELTELRLVLLDDVLLLHSNVSNEPW